MDPNLGGIAVRSSRLTSVRSHRSRRRGKLQIGSLADTPRVLQGEPLEARTLLAVDFQTGNVSGDWIELGPAGAINAQVENIDIKSNGTYRNPVVGAVQQLALFPSSGKTGAYAATVSGGLWKTANISDPNPDWSVLGDLTLNTKSFSSITVDPRNSDHVVAGTGDVTNGGNLNVSNGLFESTNGGGSWHNLSQTVKDIELNAQGKATYSNLGFGTTVRTIVFPQTLQNAANTDGKQLLAATSLGILINSDSSQPKGEWKRLSGYGGLAKGYATDVVEIRNSSTPAGGSNSFYAAVPGEGIFRSTDLVTSTGTPTWTKLSFSGSCQTNFAKVDNIRFAVQGTGSSHVLYAGIVLTGNTTGNAKSATFIYKITNEGSTCTSLGAPGTANADKDGNAIIQFLNSGNQGRLNFSIAVHPTQTDLVFVGGDGQKYVGGVEGNTISSVGRLFYYDAVPHEWKVLTSEASGVDRTYPHADSRNMVYVSDNTGSFLLETSDGGIYHLSNPTLPARTWTSRMGSFGGSQKTMNVAEAYNASYHRDHDVFYVSVQDNGTLQSTSGASTSSPWDHIKDGDGNVTVYAEYPGEEVEYIVGNNYGSPEVYRWAPGFAGPPTPSKFSFDDLGSNDKKYSNDGSFIGIALAANAKRPGAVATGAFSLYESKNYGAGWSTIGLHNPQKTAYVRAIAYGTAAEPSVLYAGYGTRIGVRSPLPTDANGVFEMGKPLNRSTDLKDRVTDVVINPDDWRVAYAITRKAVWRTVDGGVTWKDITTTLRQDITLFNTIEIYNPTSNPNDEILMVGGYGGVLASNDPRTDSPDWARVGKKLPRMQVTDLHSTSDKNGNEFLFLSTWGRGIWRLNQPAQALRNVMTITGDENASNLNDIVQLKRNATQNELVTVTVNGVNKGDYLIDAIAKIQVKTGTGSDTLIVDNSNGVIGRFSSESPNTPFIEFLDQNTPGDSDALAISGILGPTTGSNYIAIGKDHDRNAATVTNSSAKLSTTIHYSGIENMPSNNNGALPADSLRRSLQSVDVYLRNAASKNTAPVNLARSAQSTTMTPKSTKPLNGSGGKKSQKSALAAEFRELASAQDFLASFLQKADGQSLLDDLGVTVNTSSEIVAAFDALDDVANSVTSSTQPDGTVLYDIRVQKVLTGDTELQTELLNGLVDVDSVLHVTGTAKLHMVLGVDNDGFFIATEAGLNAQGVPEPEIIFEQLSGTLRGAAQLGFLEVQAKTSQVNFDPGLKFTMNLHDPGTVGGSVDGKLRLPEFDPDLPPEQLTMELVRNPNATQPDIEVLGHFDVAGFDVPLLTDVQIDLRWPNINDLSQGTIAPHLAADGRAAKMLDFLTVEGEAIVGAVRDLATYLEASSQQASLLDKKVPLVNKTIGELLNAVDHSFTLTPDQIVSVSPILDDNDQFKTFEITVDDSINLLHEGISVKSIDRSGGTIRYLSGNTLVDADIVSVHPQSLVVQFPVDDLKEPDANNPVWTLARGGSIFDRISSIADGVDFSIPSLQSLIQRLEQVTGFDILSGIKVVPSDALGDLQNAYLQIPFDFELDPLKFSNKLDLTGRIRNLELESDATFDITVKPKFHLPLGIRLGSNVSAADRFFLPEDETPEVQLDLEANLVPHVSGSIGFLNIALRPDPAIVDNKGLQLTTGLTVNLTDPGTGANDDGAIRFSELAQNLSSVFAIDVSGSLDIDGLELAASLGNQNPLASLKISLDGETEAGPGRIDSLDDFARLLGPQGISITGDLSGFESFSNIGPQQIFQALQLLVEQLRNVGRGGALDRPIPLINKSVSELIDLGEAWSSTIGQPDSANAIATAQGLQQFLQSKLGNTATVQVTVRHDDILFEFGFAKGFERNIPLNFAIGNSGISLVGNSNLSVSACADLNLALGISTAPDLSVSDRVFLDTSANDEVNFHVVANAGYQNVITGACGAIGNSAPFQLAAAVGPLALNVNPGRALIDLSVTGNLSASNNQLRLTNLASAALTPSFTGNVQAILPLDGDGGGVAVFPHELSSKDALIAVAGKFNSLTALTPEFFSFPLTTNPNPQSNDLPHHASAASPLTDVELNAIGINRLRIVTHNVVGLIQSSFLNFGTLISGLEMLIDRVDQLLGTDALDFKIPFVGKSLRDGLNFLESDRPGAQVVHSIVSALVSDGSGGLQSNSSTDGVREAIGVLREALRKIPGIRAIRDLDGDGIENATAILNGRTVLASGDDLVKVTETAAGIQGVMFYIGFAPEFDFTLPLDLGLDFLRFQADATGTVTFDGQLDVQLGFGIDRDLGFFLDTALAGPEFALSGKIQPDATLSAKLGLLDVMVSLAASKNYMTTRFSMDLDDGPNTDGKLTLGELSNFAQVETYLPSSGRKLEVEAHLDASILTSIASPNQGAAGASCSAVPNGGNATQEDNLFPSLSGRLTVDWAAPAGTSPSSDPNPNDGKPFDLLHNTASIGPTVRLRDIQLDMGSFVQRMIAPLLRHIQESNLLPLNVIEFLSNELPVIKKTPRELLTATLNQDQRRIVDFILSIGDLIAETENLDAEDLKILFGDILITGNPSNTSQAVATPTLTDATITTSQGAPGVEKNSTGDQQLKIPGSGLPVVGSFLEKLGNLGIFFPVLRLSTLANLLVGRDVDLVFIDVPELSLSADVELSVPLAGVDFSPLFAVAATLDISGGFEFQVNLSGGFDTSGLRNGRFFDGFYLGDYDPGNDGQIQATDSDRAEVSLTGFVQAAVTGTASVLEFDIAKISGLFRIEASMTADLNDDNEISGNPPSCDPRSPEERHDGKLHFGEMQTISRSHGDRALSVLDIGGSVDAELGLHVTVLDGILFDRSYYFPIPIASFELAFPVDCPPDPNEPAGQNEGPASVDEDTFTLDIDVSSNGFADVTDIVTSTLNRNGNLFDGQNVAGFNVDEILMNQFGEDVLFEMASPSVDLAASNIEAGMGVSWQENGVAVQGVVTSVTKDAFRATKGINAGAPRAAVPGAAVAATPVLTSNVVVNSGRETIVVQAGGFVQYFGPEECGSANLDSVDDIREIVGSLGAGNDRFEVDHLVTTPVRVDAGDGRDVVIGGSGPLVAQGGKGNDLLQAGDRTLKPGDPKATGPTNILRGEEGDDFLRGSLGSDQIVGGEGDDDLRDKPESDRVKNYDSGADQVVGGGGKDEIVSTGGDDVIVGDYDQLLDERPTKEELQREDQDSIKQTSSGRVTIFGDNRGVGSEIGPKPAATRVVSDTIESRDAAAQLFIDAGDKVVSPTVGGTAKLSANNRPIVVTPTSILMEGERPVEYGPGTVVYVVDGSGVVQALGTEKADSLSVRTDSDGLHLQWGESGHVIIRGVSELVVATGESDDLVIVEVLSDTTSMPRAFQILGEGSTRLGDTLRITGDNRLAISGQSDSRQSHSASLSIGDQRLDVVGMETMEVSQLDSFLWTTSPGEDKASIEGVVASSGERATKLASETPSAANSSIVFYNVSRVTLDLSSADDPRLAVSDQLTIEKQPFQASGLAQFDALLGEGNDTINVMTSDVGLASRGPVTVNAGSEVDQLMVQADSSWTLERTQLTSSSGILLLSGLDREPAMIVGGSSANRFTVTNWSGPATVDGQASTDTLLLSMNGGTLTTAESLVFQGNLVSSAATTPSIVRGSMDLGAAAHTLQVADGTAAIDLQMDAILSGSGTLTKAGTGTAVITGQQRHSGLLDITSGLVRYDGTNTAQRVQVRTGSRFGGNGAVGAVNSVGGQIVPGTTIGRLTTSGLSLDSLSSMVFDLSGATAGSGYDQVVVNGGVTLSGTLTTAVNFTPVVGSTYTLIDNDGTDAVRGVFSGLAEGATFTSGAATFRISYRGGTGNDVVLTHLQNTAPKFPNRTLTTLVLEGGQATLSGTVSEPDAGDIFIMEIVWGDGTPMETFVLPPGTPSASFTHRYADNPSSGNSAYRVAMLWKDQHGAFNTGILETIVQNVAPQLAPLDAMNVTSQGLFVGSGHFGDPGQDQWTARVDYGDGAGWETLSLRGQQFDLAHYYQTPGDYLIQVEVADDDGGVDRREFDLRVDRTDGRLLGDANGDGRFGSADLVFVLAAGKYESGQAAVFEEGDWNGDGQFDSSDLIAAWSMGNYEGAATSRPVEERSSWSPSETDWILALDDFDCFDPCDDDVLFAESALATVGTTKTDANT